ncbi:predicted protein [Lichtheimia corymbifera JMRC:FSU:9682]|uniref:Uncharacterized protein n=1 Tax=Lichtheimia corymbifera JMRC:FSU:9682 TaxID=1263082 RepID=A0A068SFB3_9FUNG|nr:predicted protein [Lichtheimia corymbifera JMRC:FSU:9682]
MFTSTVLTTLILDLARCFATYLLYVLVLSTTLHGDLDWLVTTSKTMLQCVSEYRNSWISVRGLVLILYLLICLVIGYMPTIGLSLLTPITQESIYDKTYDVDTSCLVRELPTVLFTNVMSSLSGYFDERCDLHDYILDIETISINFGGDNKRGYGKRCIIDIPRRFTIRFQHNNTT